MSDITISGKGTIQNGCNHQSDMVAPVSIFLFSTEGINRCVLGNLVAEVVWNATLNQRSRGISFFSILITGSSINLCSRMANQTINATIIMAGARYMWGSGIPTLAKQ